MKTICAECEYLGDCVFPIVDYFSFDTPRFVGFSDRPNGQIVEFPARNCNHEKYDHKTLVYEDLKQGGEACAYFKKREWARPAKCIECERRTVIYPSGQFLCSGYPFCETHNNSDAACINGRTRSGIQLKLF